MIGSGGSALNRGWGTEHPPVAIDTVQPVPQELLSDGPDPPNKGYGAQMAVGLQDVVSQIPALDGDLPATLSRHWAGLGWSLLLIWDLGKLPKWVWPSLVHSLPATASSPWETGES